MNCCAGELFIPCLVIEPPKIHSMLILRDSEVRTAKVRIGSFASLKVDADLGIWGLVEHKFNIGISFPFLSVLLNFALNEWTSSKKANMQRPAIAPEDVLVQS